MEVPVKLRSALAGFHYWLVAFIFMATSTFLVACGGGGSTTVITTIADTLNFNTTATVQAGKQYTIIVQATAGGASVVGETIRFQITQNQSGSDVNGQPFGSVATNGNGIASVLFTAGTLTFQDPPIDIIRVNSTNPNLTGTVTITVTPPDVDSVTVTPSDTELYAIGTDRTVVVALVEAEGKLVGGMDVDFTTSAGTICAYGTLPADPCSATQPLTAQTGTDGKARVILQSSTNLETATIEAVASSTSGSADVDFIVGPPGNIDLYASPNNITANFGTSELTAVVTDAAGHLVADNTIITFKVLGSSTGTGGFTTLLVPQASDTTAGGLASATFNAGDTVGPVDIQASAGTAASTDKIALITIIDQVIGSISLSIPDNILTADGADYAEVHATVLDSNLNPISGVTVTFTTTGGGFDDDFPIATPATPQNANTNAFGIATVYLQSSTIAGTYSVKATVGSKSDIAPVQFVPGPADDTKSMLSNPPSILADGISTATLTLTAKDFYDNPVADGTSVTFTTSAGVFTSTSTRSATTTTTGGIATAVLRSSTTSTATVNLAANMTGFVSPVTGTMAFTYTSSVDPVSIVLGLSGGVSGSNGTKIVVESPGGSTPAIITATVKNGSGNLIPDCADNIQFDVISGPADAKLDGVLDDGTPPDFPITKSTLGGVASVSLSAGALSGTVRVEARVVKKSDCSTAMSLSAITTPIVIASGAPAYLTLFPEPDLIDIAGSLTGQIFNAMVTDSYGNPVENGTAVFFSLAVPSGYDLVCDQGFTGIATTSTDCAGVTTAIKGVARTRLTWAPSKIWDTFTLNANTGGTPSDSYSGTYPAVADVDINVVITPASVASGTLNVPVTATLFDGSSPPNRIPGINIDFTSGNGSVTVDAPASGTTNDAGQVFATLDTATCLANNITVPITAAVSLSPYFGDANLVVTATRPQASFDITDNGGRSFTFTNTSIEPPGYTYTYAWTFGDTAGGTSALENPTYIYGIAEIGNTLPVTLTVTNTNPPVIGTCVDSAGDSVLIP